MNKPKTNNFLKLAYFDEQAAVDFLERLDEGDITVCGKINVHTIAAQKYTTPQAA